MNSRLISKLGEMAEGCLEDIVKSGQFRSTQDLMEAKAALRILQISEEIGGSSGRISREGGNSYEGNSYRRGRNQNNGQYMSRDGGMNATAQSGHSIMQHFKEMLEDMAQNGGREGQEAEDMLRFMR